MKLSSNELRLNNTVQIFLLVYFTFIIKLNSSNLGPVAQTESALK